jgi:hypothetical protein
MLALLAVQERWTRSTSVRSSRAIGLKYGGAGHGGVVLTRAGRRLRDLALYRPRRFRPKPSGLGDRRRHVPGGGTRDGAARSTARPGPTLFMKRLRPIAPPSSPQAPSLPVRHPPTRSRRTRTG